MFESGFFGLSPATIRSEMSQLEDSGYLIQMHTSGGRVPSYKAYRHFVDNVVVSKDIEIDQNDKEAIDSSLDSARDINELNRALANTLASLSESIVIASIDDSDDFYKTGLSSMFEHPELQEFDHMFKLVNLFDHFESIFDKLADKMAIDDESIKIFIGRESPFDGMDEEAVMVAHYKLPYRNRGSLTLIGSMRMNYAKNLGLIRYVQKKLNNISQKYE